MMDKPRTPASTLKQAREIARSSGIKYCYVGNVFDDEGQTTYCPNCGAAVVRRSWHDILEYRLVKDCCPCGAKIPGHFELDPTKKRARQDRRPVPVLS